MTLADLTARLPDYARDIARNLEVLAEEEGLTDQQKWGCFLACAHAIGVAPVVQSIEAEAGGRLSPEAADAARGAAALMGMNNIYYRALHIMKNPEYGFMPSKLRMNAIGQSAVDKLDFELWSLAVSAVNGCGACLDAHEGELKTRHVPPFTIQAALRIAAVVHAASRVIASADARSA